MTKEEKKTMSKRISLVITEDDHKALIALAKKKKVGLAWVVRDAISDYLIKDAPLLKNL